MSKDLFREEALDQHRQRLHGDVLLLPKFSHTVLISLLAGWLIVVLAWLIFSSYAKKETVNGWLEPPTGVIRIYPESTGIIQSVLVSEGQQVKSGDVLLSVSNEVILGSGQQLEESLIAEFQHQEKLLQDQLIRLAPTFQEQESTLVKQIQSGKAELSLIDAQKITAKNRDGLLQDRYQKYTELKKQGHVSQLELDQINEQKMAVYNQLKELERADVAQKNTISRLQSQLALLPQEQANQQSLIQEKLSELSQQKNQIIGKSTQLIKAPRDGIVNNLQAVEGQQAILGRTTPLLTLLPENTELKAQLLVPVRSAGFLAEGQSLTLRYDAFPYQKFGMYKATVEKVSNTILLPNELLNAPLTIQEPVYRITAQLDRLTVQAYGKDFPLRPGMTLNADINLSERSILQWLLEPIYSLQGRL
jgi:membrane fusion protein